jgi:hypothetical protein
MRKDRAPDDARGNACSDNLIDMLSSKCMVMIRQAKKKNNTKGIRAPLSESFQEKKCMFRKFVLLRLA